MKRDAALKSSLSRYKRRGLRPPLSPNGRKMRVLLVDDNSYLRRSMARLIDQEKDLTVCSEAGNAQEALHAIRVAQPDLSVLDISLPGCNGLELLKVIRILFPKLPVLMLSMHDASLFAEACLEAGANGYLMKQEGPEKLLATIRSLVHSASPK